MFALKAMKQMVTNMQSCLWKGARVIVCQHEISIEKQCTVIKVTDTRKAMAIIGSNFYGNQNKLKLIGVTGTNGKTTSTFMIKSILETAGFKVGVTLVPLPRIGRRVETSRTTPESLGLHKLLKKWWMRQ